MGAKYTAVCAAISEGFGFELFSLYDEAVNHELFIAFLEKLVEINPDRQLAIVMDNLSAHTKTEVKDRMRALGILWILNVPYSPQYNAIELPFGQIKKKFRELKLQCLVNERQFNQKQAIIKSFKFQKKRYIDKCINHCLELIGICRTNKSMRTSLQ